MPVSFSWVDEEEPGAKTAEKDSDSLKNEGKKWSLNTMVALDHDQVYQMIVNSSHAQAIIFYNLPFFFKISAASHVPYGLYGMVSSLSIERILKWQHVTYLLLMD
ncbi:hypothetical protein ACFX12_030095 [Malus domestica]